MMSYLGAGVILGCSAGFSPGPLFALVLSQTLRHGIREGCKVAFAPLVTDLPIILLTTLLLTQIARFKPLLGGVSFAGAAFLAWMAYGTYRSCRDHEIETKEEPKSLSRGILTNLLSPHPYLFWVAVGAPMVVKGWNASPVAAVAFLLGFYGCLVGAKLVLAVLVGRSRRFLAGRAYRVVMRSLAVMLLVFAGLLLRDGIELVAGAVR